MIRHFLIILFVLQALFACAQPSDQYNVLTRLLGVEDGLASREVFCGLQDKHGFIWFGTRNGLNRYDGTNMLLFNRQHNELQQNKVIHLAHDNQNLLFIVYGESGYHRRTNGTVDVMNISTLKVQSLSKTFPKMPFKEKDVFWITNTTSDKVYILTANPFRLWEYSAYHPQNFKLVYNLKEGKDPANIYPSMGPYTLFPNSEAALFYEKKTDYELVTNNRSTTFIPGKDVQFLPFATTKDNEYLLSYNSWHNLKSHFALINKQGKIELPIDPERYALSELNGKQFEFAPVVNDSSLFIKLFEKGLFLFKKGKLIPIVGDDNDQNYKDISIYAAFADKSGKLWLCSSIGVFQVKLKINVFQHYLTQKQQRTELNNQVRGIYVDSAGQLYANVWETLFVLDGKSTKHVSLSNHTNYRHLIYALHPHQNRLYVGGYIPLLYDETHNRLQELKNNYVLQDIWAMYSLADDLLLLGRNDDIELYNIKTQKSKRVAYNNHDFPKARFVYRFLKSRDGAIWAVSENGLFKLNAQGAVVDYYGESKDSAHRLPYSNLADVCEDRNGIFWLATNGDGLYRWNRQSNEFKQFKITEGLPSDILYRIETDARNNLWISSDYGLIQFNTSNYSTRTYTVKDGISSNEFNRISSFKGIDGRLYFGGLNGINAFYPEHFWNDTTHFNAPLQIISISKFTADNGLTTDLTSEMNAGKTIEIKPEDNFFRLEFMLLDFEKENHKYAYKIEGLDNDWNYINEGAIRLSGLPYGEYILHIKGQNQSGQWSSQELTFPLVVIAPFYKKTEFIILSVLLVILMVFVYVKYRTYKLTKDNENLEQTVNQRTEELKELLEQKDVMMKEIHHRVKNNLQVISSLLEIQGIRTTDDNVRSVISESQNRVLSIAFIHQNLYQHDNFKGVEMATFVNELTRHISTVFSKSGQTIKLENTIGDVFLDIDTAVPLGLIINELMTNSYKYAFENRASGIIKIALTAQEKGHFHMEYFDDGIGLPQGIELNKSSTLGLRLIKQLSKQLHGVIHYRYASGSLFELDLKDSSIRTKTN